MKIDLDQIRNLLSVVSQTDISELTIESGDEKITVKKGTAASLSAAPQKLELTAGSLPVEAPRPAAVAVQESAPAPSNNNNSEKSAESNGYVSITSPMVGTFYRASSPTAAPFVDVGDRISVGQTVCIIEAMKLMNDLPAEISGKIVKCLVDNGMTVEFGQPLFLVDPKG